MHPTGTRAVPDVRARLERAKADYADLCKARLDIDMTRGKPSTAQLDLSNAMLTLPGNADFYQDDGGDTRNYFGSVQGLPEARALFAPMMGAPPERILIGNNSSLALMHDCVVYALLKGVPGGATAWRSAQPVTFLCPAPGYDRHFAICEAYGIRMIAVPLTGSGPDMEVVERLVLDPAVRGMWCVPKYSNPTAETYSEEVVERIARMRTGAADFRVFWDNAYGSTTSPLVRWKSPISWICASRRAIPTARWFSPPPRRSRSRGQGLRCSPPRRPTSGGSSRAARFGRSGRTSSISCGTCASCAITPGSKA